MLDVGIKSAVVALLYQVVESRLVVLGPLLQQSFIYRERSSNTSLILSDAVHRFIPVFNGIPGAGEHHLHKDDVTIFLIALRQIRQQEADLNMDIRNINQPFQQPLRRSVKVGSSG